MPAGRPTKYDPKYCDEIIEFMKDGRSIVAFAAHIEVADVTLYEWKKVHPEFSRAIKVAMAKCQSWWEDQGRMGLHTGRGEGFSQSAWIFNMKARFGYRDKQELDVNHEGKIELGYNLDYAPGDMVKREESDD